jgi:hypothetical protein
VEGPQRRPTPGTPRRGHPRQEGLMKTHIQNPWTRSPQVFVHMTVEEAQQLVAGLDQVYEQFGKHIRGYMDHNQQDALEQLRRVINHVLATERPHGIKGVTP